MDVTPLVKEGAQIIQSYAGGVFRVSGKAYEHPIIVTPDSTIDWKTVRSAAEIVGEATGAGQAQFGVDDFDQIVEVAPDYDVFICGTGAAIKFLKPDIKNALKEKGVSIEVMDTGAACRTYNVLMAEGRRVLVALIPT